MPQTEEQKAKKREYMRKYHIKNREKILAKHRLYHINNREAILEKQKQYSRTEKEIKRCKIKTWKKRGIICDDFDELYSKYLNAKNCDNCLVDFGRYGDGTGTYKTLDHSHTTGKFRNFLCQYCNLLRGEEDN